MPSAWGIRNALIVVAALGCVLIVFDAIAANKIRTVTGDGANDIFQQQSLRTVPAAGPSQAVATPVPRSGTEPPQPLTPSPPAPTEGEAPSPATPSPETSSPASPQPDAETPPVATTAAPTTLATQPPRPKTSTQSLSQSLVLDDVNGTEDVPGTGYRVFPNPRCTCRHPDGPVPTIPHPRSDKLLQEFLVADPMGVYRGASTQRRMLVAGDSYPRFVFARIITRLTQGKHVTAVATDDGKDPLKVSATYGKHVPFINWPPSFVKLAGTPPMVLRSETDTCLSFERNWTHLGAKGFDPTHIVVNRGTWDMGHRFPHGPRRSNEDFARTLVALRREFPAPVRIVVYGLHNLIKMRRWQGPGVECVFDREHLPYRSAFYCAVRRANAILVRDLGPGALTDGSLIEYLDTYSITQNATRGDTWNHDGAHYDGPVLDRITDGLLELLIEKPNPPPPLVLGGPCKLSVKEIVEEKTPCSDILFQYQVSQGVRSQHDMGRAAEFWRRLSSNATYDDLYELGSKGRLRLDDPLVQDFAVGLAACSRGMLKVYNIFGGIPGRQILPNNTKEQYQGCQSIIDQTLTQRFFVNVLAPLANPGFRLSCEDIIYLYRFQSPAARDRVLPPDDINESCFKAHWLSYKNYEQMQAAAYHCVMNNYPLTGGCDQLFVHVDALMSSGDATEIALSNPIDEFNKTAGTTTAVMGECVARFTANGAAGFTALGWRKALCPALKSLQSRYGSKFEAAGIDIPFVMSSLSC